MGEPTKCLVFLVDGNNLEDFKHRCSWLFAVDLLKEIKLGAGSILSLLLVLTFIG